VIPGATFSAQLGFAHANGDIDAELFTECDGATVAASAGQTGSESVTWINAGEQPAMVLLRVYLASDTRNTYSMTVSNGVPAGFGACCLPGGCSILSSAACAASGGVYAGDTTTCASGCHTYSYAGPAIGISDGTSGCGAAAVCTVTVPESFPVSGIGVGVRIVHGYQGDVKFLLRHVGTGATVSLVDRPGVPPSSFGFPNDNFGASVTNLFRSLDAAAQRYDTPVVGVDNVAGAWKPESPLAAFMGLPSAGQWQLLVQDCASGETGQVVAFTLTLGRGAATTCYANCDQSTALPVLTGNDFQCFLNLFASGSSLANCDGSSVPPVLTGNDFQCFLTSFVAGCS
jgi:subtilisin-like proprotein convertase family protein